ncbi:L-histidine N(alpha)-methyltransferase [Bradyrhizobium sp. LB14.3]|uniref:L-histidine N(alpha)-methyltransferase n=1 Tax=Bradyrhizobium sp. LB14.3 TaxID=3156328 RepID=UPI0033941720
MAESAIAFRNDVFEGLSLKSKAIPARSLYDHRGSALFEAITLLPWLLSRFDNRKSDSARGCRFTTSLGGDVRCRIDAADRYRSHQGSGHSAAGV